MKTLFLFAFTGTLLFAGGDILPVEPMTKFEKMDNEEIAPIDTTQGDLIEGEGCQYDNIKPAELLPYNNEDIPDAQIEPYDALEKC